MRHLFRVMLVMVLMIFESEMTAQISPSAEAAARNELSKRGLDEDQVRRRLEERGIDLNNINPQNAQQMLEAQAALDEVLKELEAEKIIMPTFEPGSTGVGKIGASDKKIIAKQSEEVSEAVEEGSTLEEAISETLTDDQTRELPSVNIYGQEIFRSQSIKLYRQSKDVKAPNNYILGVGDIVAISIWGASEESQIYEINDDGYIKPAGIPRIYLKGIAYDEARSLLRKRFSSYYNFEPNQFEISLNFSRTINVSVVGEVFNFGSFNIPAINTAFNALVAAGGPNEIGSVRRIQLLRSGKEPRTIDVYKYIMNPAISGDFFLQENDIIHVPVAKKLVTISGAVKRPFTYELLENENLKQLIIYARGLKPNAILKNVQVIRYVDDEEKIIDLNLSELEEDGLDFTLMAGDRISVKSIEQNFSNFIYVNGAVEGEGKYAFSAGDRLSDLSKKVNFADGALLDLTYIKRLNSDRKTISYVKVNFSEAIKSPGSSADIELQSEDRITVLNQGLFVDESSFSIRGAVRNPNSFIYDNNRSLRVSDAVFLAGGLNPTASNIGYIKRQDRTNPNNIQYLKIDFNAIEESQQDSEINPFIEASDVIIVQSLQEFSDMLFVSIEGFVREPGKFVYDESLSLKDVLTLSGGLKYEAASNQIDIYRVNRYDDNKTKIVAANVSVDEEFNIIGRDVNLEPFDQIVVRRAPEFELQQNVIITGKVKYPGKYALINKNERLSELIQRAGGLTEEASLEAMTIKRGEETGFIIADYVNAMKKPGSSDDIILKAGDNIVIPKLENLVSITGFTTANELFKDKDESGRHLSVPYEAGKNAKYYINKYAGGVAVNGNSADITVKEINGKVSKVSRFLFFKNYPEVGRGATIHVGGKTSEPIKQKGEGTDWARVFQNSVAQATSILTLLLLVQRID